LQTSYEQFPRQTLLTLVMGKFNIKQFWVRMVKIQDSQMGLVFSLHLSAYFWNIP